MDALNQTAPASHAVDSKHVFLTLDGLRGIAALSVVLFHFSIGVGLNFMPNAFLAVDFFFVLSGFVIAHAYEHRFRHGMTFKEFMVRRLIRLYPLYLAAITLSLFNILFDGAVGLPHPPRSGAFTSYAFSLAMLPTPPGIYMASTDVFPLDIPAWSLSLEIWINAFYAASIVWLKTWRLALIALIGGFALVLLLSMQQQEADGMGADAQSYLIGWARVVWSFLIGIVLYRIYRMRPRRIAPARVAIFLSLALLLIFDLELRTMFWLHCILLVFPLIVYLGAHVGAVRGQIGQLLRKAGEISYALYITHLPVGEVISTSYRLANLGSPKDHPVVNLLIWSATTVAVAYLLDRIFDIPIRRFLTRRRLHARSGSMN